MDEVEASGAAAGPDPLHDDPIPTDGPSPPSAHRAHEAVQAPPSPVRPFRLSPGPFARRRRSRFPALRGRSGSGVIPPMVPWTRSPPIVLRWRPLPRELLAPPPLHPAPPRPTPLLQRTTTPAAPPRLLPPTPRPRRMALSRRMHPALLLPTSILPGTIPPSPSVPSLPGSIALRPRPARTPSGSRDPPVIRTCRPPPRTTIRSRPMRSGRDSRSSCAVSIRAPPRWRRCRPCSCASRPGSARTSSQGPSPVASTGRSARRAAARGVHAPGVAALRSVAGPCAGGAPPRVPACHRRPAARARRRRAAPPPGRRHPRSPARGPAPGRARRPARPTPSRAPPAPTSPRTGPGCSAASRP